MVKQEIKSFVMDSGKYSGLACTAPCSLYSVLFENGVTGDPSVSDNVARLLPYSDKDCVFTAEFEITPLVISMKNVLLRFHGLDGFCTVEINGQVIGETDNVHRTYVFDVKTKLSLGKNVLKLSFSAGKNGSSRKIGSTLGSEGSPRLCDMGIFRKIEVVAFNHKIISDIKVKQTHTEGAVRLDLSVSTLGYDELSRAVATLTSPAGNVYFCGFVGGEGNITVSDPNLWWPNGLGMQNLYKLNVNLYSESEIEDTYEMRIGLRTVALEKDGEGMTLCVNGSRVLAMGGEYMCEDILPSRLSEKRTRALLEDAKKANFNSIFIHGSGYYPENYFFDACDELGLLVWAELPIEDSEAEDTQAFRESVGAELRDNLTRIVHHPSLGVIVGNGRVQRLFGSDNEAAEFAGSFSAFDGMNVFDISGETRKHLVRVGHSSLPTYDTATRLAEPEKRNLGSEVFELHGASRDAVIDMISGAYDSYPYANGMKELSYVMGMCSAELSMLDVEEARRKERKPLGIFMRRMNDPWPSISPSAVDYYGGRKPLHYYEKAFFAPVRISAIRGGTRVKFIVSNDMRQDYVGVFTYAVMNSKNQPVFRDSFPIRVKASSNLRVHDVDLGSAISGHENEYYLLYSVSDKSNESSKGAYLFTKNKRFAFPKPNYSIEVMGNGTEYVATVSADCFVKGAEVSFEGEDVSLDKNYFDITGKAPIRLRLTTPRITTIEKLKRVIRVRSLYDLGVEE
ncbi:MAG: hypothetical protein IJW53_04320 [Clostridia bacterium]|nr:hypothetical protein [Clostridia bacterium]